MKIINPNFEYKKKINGEIIEITELFLAFFKNLDNNSFV